MKRRTPSRDGVRIQKKAAPLCSMLATLGDQEDPILFCRPVTVSNSPSETDFITGGGGTNHGSSTGASVDPQGTVTNETDDYRTGLVFEPGSQHFDRGNRFHQERPQRVTSILEALRADGTMQRCTTLLDDGTTTPSTIIDNFLNDEDYFRVHLPGYMQRLDKLSSCNCDRLDREAEQFQSIYFTQHTINEAKRAAASLCRLVTQVIKEDELDNGFAVIRPPGHHAEPGLAGGYCVVNNVAVAAAFSRERLGLQRVLIVDWDVHLGNGTQAMFHSDPSVLYFSVHRWHGGNFYPFSQRGGPTHVGGGNGGAGYTVNVGWSCKGMGDDEYVAVWERVLLPIAHEFRPDLILVSAGFDAALGDMGECNVTPEGFGRLTRSLMVLGKVVCALEGGYVRTVLGNCVKEVVRALLDRKGREQSKAAEPSGMLDHVHPSARKSILATIAAQKPYWKCFQYQE